MLLTNCLGQDVRMHFYHGYEGGDIPPYLRNTEEARHRRRITVCTLHLGPCAKKERPCGTEDSVVGIAIQGKLDPFIKVIGRQIALNRALDRAQLGDPLRSEIRRRYYETTRPPRRGIFKLIQHREDRMMRVVERYRDARQRLLEIVDRD